jgi:deazaflavin-dependent oxidoreductase (nitroreductase family)
VADSAPGRASDFNTEMIEEFRANGGRVGGPWEGTTLILIHHIGARSGVERVTPLGCSSQGDGRFVIVASSGGSPMHPDWYYNLKANPRIIVEVGAQTFTVLADELAGAARAELWPKLVEEYPTLGEHQARTTRQLIGLHSVVAGQSWKRVPTVLGMNALPNRAPMACWARHPVQWAGTMTLGVSAPRSSRTRGMSGSKIGPLR